MLMRRLHHAHRFVAAGHWPRGELGMARKVSGKRFGILGMGRIGQAVARRSGFSGAFTGRGSSSRRARPARFADRTYREAS